MKRSLSQHRSQKCYSSLNIPLLRYRSYNLKSLQFLRQNTLFSCATTIISDLMLSDHVLSVGLPDLTYKLILNLHFIVADMPVMLEILLSPNRRLIFSMCHDLRLVKAQFQHFGGG